VRRAAVKLQDLASEALAAKMARDEIEDGVLQRYRWHAKKGKGRGADAKRRSFNAWFDERLRLGTYVRFLEPSPLRLRWQDSAFRQADFQSFRQALVR